ncbi:MAG: hypothetical protein K6C95_03490 [Lachnospiraceae bacterium]|nr:hypothetical protein [Lachnospiraceae bacterium]
MNGNDLMDALSGIDPKFIEEAAFELNAKPVQEQRREKASVKRGFFIALPIAAAAILTIAVAYPFLMRISKTGSSSPSLSDSASYAPAEEAASEMPVQAEAEAQNEAMDSAALAPAEDAVSEMPAQAEITGSAAQEAAKENARDSRPFTLSSASYESGLLTVAISGTLPAHVEDTEYTIETTDSSDVRAIYEEGTLGTVLISEDPLILDLTGLDLKSGTYILTIAEESIEFDV